MDTFVQTTNSQTGTQSNNLNTSDVSQNRDTTVSNSSSTTNAVDFSLNTGGNTTSNNTHVGSITSGSAGTDISLATQTKAATLPAGPTANDPTIQSQNLLTGSQSTNQNLFTLHSDNSQTATNRSEVTNQINLVADTGHNSIQHNTVVGNVESGSIHLAVKVDNQINQPGVGGGDLPVPTPSPTPPPPGGSTSVPPPPLGVGGGTFALLLPSPSPTPLGVGGGNLALASQPRYFAAGSTFLQSPQILLFLLTFLLLLAWLGQRVLPLRLKNTP